MNAYAKWTASLLPLIAGLAMPGLAMAERYQEKGVISYTTVKRDAVPTPHNTGEMLAITQASGTYTENGNDANPLNGAEAVSVTFSDTTKGNGVGQGWVTFSKNGEMAYVKTVMQITTVTGADGKPATSASGSYEKVGGTGQFKNIKGAGGFTVKYTSPTTYVVTVDGWAEQ